MNLLTRSGNILRKSTWILAVMAISVFAFGQHKEESKPPAQHSGGASHASAPHQSNAGGHASAPSHSGPSGNRAGGPAPNRGGVSGGNRGGVSGGNRGGVAGGNRGGVNGGNRGVNGGNRGGVNTGNRGGINGGNRGVAGGRTAPGRTVSLRGGGSASIRPNGQIRSINRNGMQIQHNLRGGRTIVSERSGVRVVTTGRGGYVQRAYVTRGGRSYYSRTYYDHGVYRVGIYRGYYYGGYRYYGYYPAYWYNPFFYGWAYQPWGAPLYWGIGIGGWGWGGAPWYGFYGGYFAPYPVYPSAAFWLTDYLIAANLQASYAAQADAASGYDQGSSNYVDGGGQASNSGSVTLSPEVKQAIAEEVKAQLAADQQQSSASGGSDAQAPSAAPADGEVPPALDPARRTFVVDGPLTVIADGQECELTAGDVVTRLTDTPDADNNVNVSIAASKKNDCAAGKQVAVSVDALQEMHNHFEEQLQNGMKALAEKQGTGGMPKAPNTGTTEAAVQPPAPDKDAAKDLADQQTQADQAETQAKQDASDSGGGQQ
jgi:hypothetical protein